MLRIKIKNGEIIDSTPKDIKEGAKRVQKIFGGNPEDYYQIL